MAHMFPARSLAFLLAAGMLAATPLVAQQVQQRAIYVSVTDKAGKPVESISNSDIIIREDKVAREILSIVPATDPIQAAVLIDNGELADPFIRYIRDGVSAFITDMAADKNVNGKHEIALIGLASRPTILKDYSVDQAGLLKAAQSVFALPGTGTYFLDAVTETANGLTKRTAPRPVFLAILTNSPDLSDRPYTVVLDALKNSGASLYVLKVGSPTSFARDRAIVMDRGPLMSGGRYEEVLTGQGVVPAVKEVVDELTHQFKVTYARPQTLIPPDTTTVESAKPDLKARGIPLRVQPNSERR